MDRIGALVRLTSWPLYKVDPRRGGTCALRRYSKAPQRDMWSLQFPSIIAGNRNFGKAAFELLSRELIQMSPNADGCGAHYSVGVRCRPLGICRNTGIKTGLSDRRSDPFNGRGGWRNTCLMPVGSPMMKIQVNERGDQLILEVEGRLAGVFVPELEQCWRSALAIRPDRTVQVDLKHVTCVDRAGRSLLQSMHCGGVVFMRAGIAIQDILEQVIQEQECKQH